MELSEDYVEQRKTPGEGGGGVDRPIFLLSIETHYSRAMY